MYCPNCGNKVNDGAKFFNINDKRGEELCFANIVVIR
mgnify:CR=1 FL=1